MADLNIQLILRLVDKATAPARLAMRAIERIGGEGMMRNAARGNRGAHLMAAGLGTVTGAALRGAAVLAAYQGTAAALTGLFIGPAAEMEKFKIQLTNLEGSAEGADKAMAWIMDFAAKTPLQLNETIAAYARLKAFGLDPTNGSMLALVDTMAATGGGVEQMDGLVLALGQAWTKGKLQGEEAMQMLERGVPVWDLLAAKMGKSSAEVMKLAEKGKLGRKEIQLLMDALGERNAGAAERISKSWDGIVSNLSDQWYRFRVMVMDSGVFDFLKEQLRGLLDTINQMAADGRLQALADQVARALLQSLKAMQAFAHQAVSAWNAVTPIIARVADLLGGWDNLAWVAVSLVMGKIIWGLVGGFAQLSWGILLVVRGLLGMVAQGIVATGIFGRLALLLRGGLARAVGLLRTGALAVGAAIQWLARAILLAGRALLANPLMLALTAIAGMAYVIYQNWDGIVSYFRGKIDRVRAAFDEGLLNGVLKTLSEFNPFVLMADAAEGLFTYITGWSFADVTARITAAFDIDLLQAGIDMIQSLWDGAKAKVAEFIEWVRSIPAMIKEAFGSVDLSDAINLGVTPNVGVPGTGGGVPARPGEPEAYGKVLEGMATPPGRALGGPVRAGMIYEWQEQGRELFSPRTDGNVISNRQLRSLSAGAGSGRRSGGLHIGGITINAAPGQSAGSIARALRRELEELTRQKGFALHDGGDFD
ncbi:tape measure protein [Pseudogemmobacter blasticus]|uniref:Tail tape measure protein n=1 Tax=Fuscovulum blasticum DSM 2131 TaxID=1188250 RepID=A0A2T4JDL0_FUSBL|nr:tape measure protein [Fuscovulum blasticum]PTE15908.1 tail tape measure protein [Fuscovulum blasticum DSM 2131]